MRQSGIVSVASAMTSLLYLFAGESAIAGQLELHLRSADAKTGAVAIKTERIDPAKCGVVIVDMWNYHWCLTAGERVRAMTPRMNRALEGARKLGMKVIWAPTDVADLYLGKPQRERAMAAEDKPIARVRSLPWHGTLGGGCVCGPGISCETIWGWDGMHPDLVVADQDYIVGADADGMYALCMKLGVSHLIYMGVHTNMCVLGKGPAIKNMYDAGFACVLARDLTDALTHYDPRTGFTPDDGTARVVSDLAQSDVPSINMADEMRAAGVWNSETPTEAVRITPWGTENHPYQFRKDSVTVTLSVPLLKDLEIHYTLDGRDPTRESLLYKKPIIVDSTTTLRAAAFQGGRSVSLPSRGFFCKLPEAPPAPDISLDALKPLEPPSGHVGPHWPMKIDRAQDGAPLAIRGKTYDKGLSGRAPAGVRFELKTDYERFVALAGCDDAPLRMRDHAMFLGRQASVVFQVFIDGEPAATSPVVRLGQEPWPIDVKIPKGSKQIHLVVAAVESPNECAVGDWVQVGFVKKR